LNLQDKWVEGAGVPSSFLGEVVVAAGVALLLGIVLSPNTIAAS
jgi:hypothetical protein